MMRETAHIGNIFTAHVFLLFRICILLLLIEKYSFIGSHRVILPGASLGEGTSVGALTLINFKTKSWNIYNGNPARNLGERNKKLIKKNLK